MFAHHMFASLLLAVVNFNFIGSAARNVKSVGIPEDKYPIVLLPGNVNSQLYMKLDDVQNAPENCKTKTDGFVSVWINPMELATIDCLLYYLSLHYDPVTHTTKNSPGVKIRVPDFGGLSSIDWLSTFHMKETIGLVNMTDFFVNLGYERDESLRGAPYDFRKAPNEMSELMVRLKNLIEDTYSQNGNKPCVLIAHSMGGTITLFFLNSMKQSWKDKYVRAFISLGTPYGGAVAPMMSISSGLPATGINIDPLELRASQRSFPSTGWLMPSSEFWGPEDILVETSTKNYTTANYEEFFTDMGIPELFSMWQDTEHLTNPLKSPGVAVHCLHGTGLPTLNSFKFSEGTFPDKPTGFTLGNGDGFINSRSLQSCTKLATAEHPVTHIEFPNVSHGGILTHSAAWAYIERVVSDE